MRGIVAPIVRPHNCDASLLLGNYRLLERDQLLAERVERLMTIPAVGPIMKYVISWRERPAASSSPAA
jgi:hypothetical protein